MLCFIFFFVFLNSMKEYEKKGAHFYFRLRKKGKIAEIKKWV
ncbi:hypothetical protein bcere0022_13920 [Bacillus cereus Rock3-44]|nr:hypothetical protein bcere0022_13920 [Bacillus cereus Rock3-44]